MLGNLLVKTKVFCLRYQQYVTVERTIYISIPKWNFHIHEPSIAGPAIWLLFKFSIAGGILYWRDATHNICLEQQQSRGGNPGQMVDSSVTSVHTCRDEVARLYLFLMTSQNRPWFSWVSASEQICIEPKSCTGKTVVLVPTEPTHIHLQALLYIW